MFSYQLYKILHIVFVLASVCSLSLIFLTELKSKWHKVISGISGFLILITGMGLLARLGIKHDQAFPMWVKAKLVFWPILMIGGPILSKKVQGKSRNFVFIFLFTITIMAVVVAVYKP